MGRRIWILAKRTYLGFTRDNCTQYAAAISYYLLFSLLPLSILVLSVFGLVLSSEEIRTNIVDRVLDALPLSQTDGRTAVENAIDSVQRISGAGIAFGLIATLWSASAVFSSIRKALNNVWGVDEHRPFAQAKLIDFLQLGVLALVLLSSMVVTIVLRAIREQSLKHVGPLAGSNPLWEVPPVVLPGVLTFVTFLLLYRIVPAAHPRWRDVIPGTVVATLLFELLKNSFAIYVANFNNYNVVYGSLGGALLFLLYMFLSSNILLIGAEASRTFQQYHAGELDAEMFPMGPQPSMGQRALQAVKGLFVRQ